MSERAAETENVNENLQDDEEILDTDAAESVISEAAKSAPEDEKAAVDYAAVAREDVIALASEFPELATLKDITELNNPMRYAALRDLGLTPAEAYLATRVREKRDNRSHLYAMRGISSSHSQIMSESELMAARELFEGVSDAQIRKLYKRVTK